VMHTEAAPGVRIAKSDPHRSLREQSRMSTKCAVWSDSPEVIADCAKIVPEFRSSEELRKWAEKYVRQHAARCSWDADFLVKNYEFSSCLNVGGAPFVFEYLIKKARPDLSMVSLDLDPKRFPEAGRVLDVKIAEINIENPDSAAMQMLGKFECVVFCEIFEHLRMDLLRTVSLLRDLLADNGILYLTTPNGLGLYSLREYLRGRTGSDPVMEWGKLTRLGHMGHVREYSRAEVCGVLEHCGFVLETSMYRRSRHRGTVRAEMMNLVKTAVTTGLPWLGDELVLVFRKAA
jgi:2-polyprenyl-3-methyl-5-hydroxy-6-metoxy-1,4-benzoquinol methylase